MKVHSPITASGYLCIAFQADDKGWCLLAWDWELLCLGVLRAPSTINQAASVWGGMLAWQAQGLAPGGRRDLLVESSMVFFLFVFFFILAATGDVEEDGGLSDSVPTSKRIPVVCLWSFAPPSSPPTVTSLGVPVSSEVAPDTICWQPVARGWGVLI